MDVANLLVGRSLLAETGRVDLIEGRRRSAELRTVAASDADAASADADAASADLHEVARLRIEGELRSRNAAGLRRRHERARLRVEHQVIQVGRRHLRQSHRK